MMTPCVVSARDAAQSRLSKRTDKTKTFESRVRNVEQLAFGKAKVATRATEALPSLGTGFETNVTYPQGTYISNVRWCLSTPEFRYVEEVFEIFEDHFE